MCVCVCVCVSIKSNTANDILQWMRCPGGHGFHVHPLPSFWPFLFFFFRPAILFFILHCSFLPFTTHLPYIHASSLTLTPLSFLLQLHPLPPLHAYTSFLPSHLPEVIIRNTSSSFSCFCLWIRMQYAT